MRTRRPPTLPSQPRSQRPRGGPHTQGLAPARGLCGTLLKPTALRRLLALAGLAAFVCMSAMSARLDPFDGGGTGAGKGEGTRSLPWGQMAQCVLAHRAALPTKLLRRSRCTRQQCGRYTRVCGS